MLAEKYINKRLLKPVNQWDNEHHQHAVDLLFQALKFATFVFFRCAKDLNDALIRNKCKKAFQHLCHMPLQCDKYDCVIHSKSVTDRNTDPRKTMDK